MLIVGWTLTFLGFALTLGGSIFSWRMDPADPRYATGLFDDDGSGTRNVIRDPGRAAAVTTAGLTTQILGAVLTIAGTV